MSSPSPPRRSVPPPPASAAGGVFSPSMSTAAAVGSPALPRSRDTTESAQIGEEVRRVLRSLVELQRALSDMLEHDARAVRARRLQSEVRSRTVSLW